MFERHELIPSRIMGRRMHLWCYGHFGPPLLAFPSASGMAHEWHAHGMVDSLAELIDAGKLKLYCTESNVAEAWTRRDSDAAWRIQRHMAFEQYVVQELVPFIREDCRSTDIPVAVSGTSLGAYYSANFTLKYPDLFRYALCMSGRYDISWLTDGYSNQDIYFNNPISYLPGLDGVLLDRLRKNVHLVLVCGQGKWEDGNIEDTNRLADSLGAKEISHERDLWGQDVSHEWRWWKRQAVFHLRRAFGS
jgi:esterase/lipase superfamily enzyme